MIPNKDFRTLSDKHYRIEPIRTERIKCFYCGSIFEVDEECPNGCKTMKEER